MSVERRLTEAFAAYESVEPAPDLFRRVELSVADDLARRRRVARRIAGIVACMGVMLLSGAAVTSVAPAGTLVAPGWSVAAAEAITLIAVIVTFGPMIRRFGAVFIEDAFGGMAAGFGAAFLQLLDVAYYLIFVGYVIVTAEVDGLGRQLSLTVMLESSLLRIGGIFALMGVIHALTLSVLPLIGLIHASTVRAVRRSGAGRELPATPGAVMAERVVRIILWALGSLMALAVLGLVAQVVVSILFGVGD
ncbi:MAG TPA: hypothetical protein VIW46_03420 [Acidimicrobiia bacterium]|jgi:hypothetical protein